jgi:hypothetical protein
MLIVGIDATDLLEEREVVMGKRTKYDPDTGKPYEVEEKDGRVFFLGEDVTDKVELNGTVAVLNQLLQQRGVQKNDCDDRDGEIRAESMNDVCGDDDVYIGRIIRCGYSNDGCDGMVEIDVPGLLKEVAGLLKKAKIPGKPSVFVGLLCSC